MPHRQKMMRRRVDSQLTAVARIDAWAMPQSVGGGGPRACSLLRAVGDLDQRHHGFQHFPQLGARACGGAQSLPNGECDALAQVVQRLKRGLQHCQLRFWVASHVCARPLDVGYDRRHLLKPSQPFRVRAWEAGR
jgi:hypothetical protein